MSEAFDLIIIGSGPGGLSAAYDGVAKGLNVAVVEAGAWGGTCPNRGCDPKKVLYSAVAARDNLLQLKGHGFTDVPEIDWEALMAFKETFTEPVSKEQRQGLINAGIKTIVGKAVFKDNHTITVADKEYQAKNYILATGQHSALLDVPGKEYFKTSTDFLSFPHLPKKLVFVGGGYISFELANIANSCGSEVHILHHNDRPLKGFDKDFSQNLVQALTEKGIHFHFNESVAAITKTTTGVKLALTSDEVLNADEVICATGRIANVEGLNLEAAGVRYSKKGLEVNEYLQTTAENIYGLGDCLAKTTPKLTPISSFEGSYLIRLLTGATTEPLAYPVLPTVAFCSPQLAQVGLASDIAETSEEYTVKELDMSQWFTYKHMNEPLVKAKIIIEKATSLCVGATVLSNEAEELVNLLTVLINNHVSATAVHQQVMLYPTVGSDLSYLL